MPLANGSPTRTACWAATWSRAAPGAGLEHLLLAGQALSVQPQRQAYTRLADRRYLFESLDGSGFQAELAVDGDGLVLDYPGLFRRV